jgi:hypothetical protein
MLGPPLLPTLSCVKALEHAGGGIFWDLWGGRGWGWGFFFTTHHHDGSEGGRTYNHEADTGYSNGSHLCFYYIRILFAYW